MSQNITNFALIIGAMKCGTTSLFDYLVQHPEIAPCSKKEPNFFADDINWAKGVAWYRDLWDWDSSKHKVALEASTHYTKMPKFTNAARRISQVEANFKFIYIMRDPLRRIESHYTHGITSGWDTTPKSSKARIDEQLIEVSKYAKQIKEYYQRFPTENILLLKFEDLKSDPYKVMKKITDFLELDPEYEFQNLGSVSNANNKRKEYPSWMKEVQPLARIVPTSIKELGKNIVGKQVKRNIILSSEEKQQISDKLCGDLQELKNKYGVDISPWEVKV